jgi:sugar-specific transcriptional regulator TrmB
MILPKLLQVGLSEREAKIYIAILELGEATIADIVKKAQIKRSTVYDMLELLKQKSLISRFYRQKRQIFCAEDPKKIIEDLEKKKNGMEEVMPELVSIMNVLDRKPKLRYFEGASGVREIFEDTLRYPDSEILTWIPFPYLNLGEEYFWEQYNPERTKKKIWMRALLPQTAENKALADRMKSYLVTSKMLTGKAFADFDIEIKIYGKTKIGIVSYSEDLGVIIESKKIFNGFKAMFEGMWEMVNSEKVNL